MYCYKWPWLTFTDLSIVIRSSPFFYCQYKLPHNYAGTRVVFISIEVEVAVMAYNSGHSLAVQTLVCQWVSERVPVTCLTRHRAWKTCGNGDVNLSGPNCGLRPRPGGQLPVYCGDDRLSASSCFTTQLVSLAARWGPRWRSLAVWGVHCQPCCSRVLLRVRIQHNRCSM